MAFIQVPFYKKNGNMCSNLNIIRNDDVEYRNNYVFEDTLKMIECKVYSNSKPVTLKSLTDGVEYRISLNEFIKVINKCTLRQGVVSGKWSFKKNGNSFTLVLIEEIL